ncbi:MAG: co-chaperone GroES, partial [Patescibacteria group bacterium]|nr:co-chaperone GroES [Patescibacteria group bacterium]
MSEVKLEPMGDHIVVTPIPEDKEMTLGTLTLVIPDTVLDKPNRGTVVAVGEGR